MEAKRRVLKTRLPIRVRNWMYALRGGFLIRPLLISLGLGLTGMMLSSAEESFPLVSAWVPDALFPSMAISDATQCALQIGSIPAAQRSSSVATR